MMDSDTSPRETAAIPVADIDAARDRIQAEGYAVVRGAVSGQEVEALRGFWLTAFDRKLPVSPIIWGPHLGEENQILYHESHDCCMYRSYDFLWNPPFQDLTRDVGLRLSRLRNQVASVDEHAGEYFEPDRYGVYITASYYPPETGWLADHEDRTDERRHWHFMLLLTFKGDDYDEGGLYIDDRHGNRIDADSLAAPGDVIFFDGNLRHGVDVIRSTAAKGLGRLQLFSIPTFMARPQDCDRLLRDVSMVQFVKAKLRPLKYRLFGATPGYGGDG